MSEIIHINDYNPTSTESFFFDCNVWIFIHYPIGNYGLKKQQKYSNLLERLINLKCNIFINSLLLSEFINTCLRSDFNEWCRSEDNKARELSFKQDFVGSGPYRESVEEILSSVEQIRKITQPGNDDFNSLNIDAILKGMQLRDFNDNYYIALAERKKWTFVSDDGDVFKNNTAKVKIVTANKQIN